MLVVIEPEPEVVDEPEVIEVVEEPGVAAVADEPEAEVCEEPLPGRMPEVAEATTELSADPPRDCATLSREETMPP